jgi:SPFH domain / Band 7 family
MSYHDSFSREQRLSLLKKAAIGVAGAAMVVGGMWSLVAMDRIDEGNFGIGQTWSGMYKEQVINQGISFNFLTSVKEVDGRNNLIQIQDIRPKDKNGVMLEDLDLSGTYNVNPDKAVNFLRNHRDLQRLESSDDGAEWVLGATNVQKIAKSAATEAIHQFESSALLDSASVVEEAVRANVQKRLDEKFGEGLFSVENFTISNVKVSPVIEQRIQSIAAQDAASAMAQAQLKSLANRSNAELEEAKSLKEISETVGMSVGELIELRRIRAFENMQPGTVQPTVSADKPKSP